MLALSRHRALARCRERLSRITLGLWDAHLDTHRVGRLCGGALQWATLLGHGGLALLTAAMYLKAALGHRLMKSIDPSQWVAAVACTLHLLVQCRSLANLRLVSGVAFWSLVLACAHLVFQVCKRTSTLIFP